MTFADSSMIAAEPRRTRRGLQIAIVLAIAGLPSVAYADGTKADSLFREGRSLLDAKKYDEACPKLAESQRQEPGAGTLLALALCHEGQGKTATAYNELIEAAALGKRVGRAELASAAQKRAQAMEPLLSRLVVRVPHADQVDYDVKCDGEKLEPKQWGTALAVDPGEHRVDVAAPGKISRSYVVRLSGAGVVEIVADPLADAPARIAVAPKPAPRVVPVTEPPAPAPSDEHPGRAQKIVGLSIVGLGVVGLGIGGYFGARALGQSSEGRDACKTAPCAPESNDANERAKSSFNWSVTSIAAGTGAIALGTIVYLLAPSASPARGAAPSSRITARVVPDVGPTQATLGLTGAF